MPALKKDIYIEQGATFTLGMTWARANPDGSAGDPYDLTGAVARMQIRKKQQDPALVDATSVNGKITLGGATGRIEIVLSDEDTDLLTSKSALYDLEVQTSDGRVVRLLQGKVTVDPNITQTSDDPAVVA